MKSSWLIFFFAGLVSSTGHSATIQLTVGDVVTLNPNNTATVSCSLGSGADPIGGVECKTNSDCAAEHRCNSVGKCMKIDCPSELRKIKQQYEDCSGSGFYCFDYWVKPSKKDLSSCSAWSATCMDLCRRHYDEGGQYCPPSCN